MVSDETVQIVYAGMPLAQPGTLLLGGALLGSPGWRHAMERAGVLRNGLAGAGGLAGAVDRRRGNASAPLLRREFSVAQPVLRARAYICGLGYYELRVNGRKVGDHELDPNWTDYDRREIREHALPLDDQSRQRVLYVTYDITGLLQPGANAVGVMLGNGWHNQRERPSKANSGMARRACCCNWSWIMPMARAR